METCLLLDPKPEPTHGGLQSSRGDKASAFPLIGDILADRYKILSQAGAENFKAHDLALDQTVTVRAWLPMSPPQPAEWLRKINRLSSVRDPNFLNILDLISDERNHFVVSERSRGQSISELFRQGSHFNLAQVLTLLRPLADSLDLLAGLPWGSNSISTDCLFVETKRWSTDGREDRSICEWSPFCLKLDVWEVVRPRVNLASKIVTRKVGKNDAKRLAVQQIALLTYALLAGEKQTDLKRGLKPASFLGKTANEILGLALRGSARFDSAESFFRRLESAVRADAIRTRESHAPVFRDRETRVLRDFNHDTECVTVGILAGVALVAVAFGVLVPERFPKSTELPRPARVDPAWNTAAATLLRTANTDSTKLKDDDSDTGMKAGEETTKISSDETFLKIENDKPSPSVSGPNFETNRGAKKARASDWFPIRREESARMVGNKTSGKKHERSGQRRLTDLDVKARLVALWRKSLRRDEKPRGWGMISNFNLKKRAAYTSGREP